MKLPRPTHLLLGFAGPRAEAEEIQRQLAEFLREYLKLELSETKTLITHARTQPARFLGYELTVLHDDRKRNRGGRRMNGLVGLKMPVDVIRSWCARYLKRGKPVHRPERLHDAPFSMVRQYQQEYRGLVEYYRQAYNLHRLSQLKWVMEASLTKTLAHKLRIRVPAVYRRYRRTLLTPEGPRKVLRVEVDREGGTPLVAEWGGISLKHRPWAVLNDQPVPVWNAHTELLERLLADTCELCGAHERIEVHHVRRLTDLRRRGRGEAPAWVQKMAARQRKTLIVCTRCHGQIHAGKIATRPTHGERDAGEPDEGKLSRPVRRGAVGKVPTP